MTMNGKTTTTRVLRGRADGEAVGSARKIRTESDAVEVIVRRRRKAEVAHEIVESASVSANVNANVNANGRRSATRSARKSASENARESGRGSVRRSAKTESEKNHRAQLLRARARRSVATRRRKIRRAQMSPRAAVNLRVRYPPWAVWISSQANTLVAQCSIPPSLRSP
jgi:hypothetical protein